MGRGEGDRGGRGRMGPPNRSNRSGERAQSPPALTDGETQAPLDREKGDYKGGRGLREHAGVVGVAPGGGVGGGGRYRHASEDRKIPRLKNARHGGRAVGGAGEGERSTDKNPPVSPCVCVNTSLAILHTGMARDALYCM